MMQIFGKTLLFAIVLAITAISGFAQVGDKKSITLEGARIAIGAAKEFAQRAGAPGGVIAVVDEGGNLVALERLDGTFAAGATVSIGKAKTAVLFKRPTKFFEEAIKNGRTSLVALPDFTPLQGGVPIVVNGQVIGGIGVSGAMSPQQDEELATAGASAVSDAKVRAVSFFDSGTVSDAFSKGAVLIDGSGGTNYMIHASRRQTAGMSEIHEHDTDIVYVLEGSADFVTGGTSVDSKMTAPGEYRGNGIDGGDVRTLKKGDVIVVPKGTPHWFRKVDGAFLYFVVKVR